MSDGPAIITSWGYSWVIGRGNPRKLPSATLQGKVPTSVRSTHPTPARRIPSPICAAV